MSQAQGCAVEFITGDGFYSDQNGKSDYTHELES
ncbi:2-octaprenyl-6-methoxyphenyl hydroxylase [Nodularia spumigena CENA596]|uniref:2-octaprenyl-6-methoxyphenyl hydroxylase n=1 Tax=Nodularia spumigena CENA596 TaxID=1819295 RepID=A0A166JZ47_NODSP|nr:2-octaprenyl-6-methoxyphenyl hydroxylase [Nodularia spumigena CCY9414]KZL50340.1 2-octaprenyl-6-methoxyphenyl hydroxylase [Nodularia spumigena CENA596]